MKADLLRRFLEFSASWELFSEGDWVLATISGGSDSVAMLDLLKRSGCNLIVAHCNFQLRGAESDSEARFVRDLAATCGAAFRVAHFQTADYAEDHGISVQMAARELRYKWFEQVRQETGCHWIAVAHQADDNVETLMTNLIRGTGLRGMSGIREKQGFIIRPLMFATRKEVIDYLKFRRLKYREDSSNRDVHYLRNNLRHSLIPNIMAINPGFQLTTANNQVFFRQAQELIDHHLDMLRPEIMESVQDHTQINIGKIAGVPFRELVLYELLRPYGFSGRQIPGILKSLDGISGKQFESETHCLLKDRQYLVISKKGEETFGKYYIDPGSVEPDLPIDLTFRIIEDLPFAPPADTNQAWLDIDKLDSPLLLRKWEPGDYFHPLGMDSSKKLSDFFIDNKISLFDKKRIWILACGEKIVWIIGHRIDNRFRVATETTRVLVATYIPETIND